MFLFILLPMVLCSLALSFVYVSWSKIIRKKDFINSLKYSFLISFLIGLIGYSYVAFAPKIFIQ